LHGAMYGPWWSVALHGILLIGFGAMALAWPDITLAVLIALFGVFVLVDGVVAAIAEVVTRSERERWWLTFLGDLFAIGIGIAVFVWPEITALALLYLIAAWALVIGLFAVFLPLVYRRKFGHAWPYVLGGLVSIAVAIALFAYPAEGALALVWLIGIYAIALGLIVTAFGVRRLVAPRSPDIATEQGGQ
jgi:uncharacterized membrane protein HdeD (DUF308 family)